MIPCPYCERGFEKRAGLMRHVTASHHSEGAVPTNPGGAIEPVIPVDPDPDMNVRHYGGIVQLGQEYIDDHPEQFVEPETYAESLDQLAPGQELYVDPPTSGVTWDQEAYNRIAHDADRAALAATGLTEDVWHERTATAELANGVHFDDVHLTMSPDTVIVGQLHPNPEQYTRIRALRRQGRPEPEAWMTVVGYPPPQRETPAEDSRPLRLQQVAFRVREGNTDHIDATWLLRLAEIGRDAVAQLQYAVDSELLPLSWAHDDANPIVDRWNETIA